MKTCIDCGKKLGNRRKTAKRCFKHYHEYRIIPAEIRFWKFVNKTKTCWLWTGSIEGEKDGYGQFFFNGRKTRTHKFSYILHKGSIPKGKHILHICDIRKCVNPNHLYAGTQSDNLRDAYSRGLKNKYWGINSPKYRH